MDFLTNALIEEHLEECMEIVKEEMQDYYLDEDEYPILTREIMLTAQSAGGDFSEGNIRFYCDEYKKHNFLSRFKRMHDTNYQQEVIMAKSVTEVLKEYLKAHESKHIGKYRFRAAYRSGDFVVKGIYYIMDNSFRTIEIFVELTVIDEEVNVTFSEKLNEQEKQYITNDLIEKIINRLQDKNYLHYSLYERFIDEKQPTEITTISPRDWIDVLNFMKYHYGVNQETSDRFNRLFRPAMANLRESKHYEEYLDAIYAFFENVDYQYEWGSGNSIYLDTEYQYHLFYLREMLKSLYENFDEFYNMQPDKTYRIIKLLCDHYRFAMMIMVDYMKRIIAPSSAQEKLFERLDQDYILFNEETKHFKDYNIVYSYLYYLYHDDHENYHKIVEDVIRIVVNYYLTYVNHDLDLALGNAFIKSEGYETIVEIFHTDYNTMIFTVFPIESFPDELKNTIRDELARAIRFFAGRMDNDQYRMSSLEQVLNINRLLLDNFREWYE